MPARVAVIIPAFNLAQYLPAAIDSALAQDVPGGRVEVIVVDDGSTDETSQVLDGYTDSVRVIRQENRGLVGAVDRGLAAADSEYLAILDADDECPRDRLRRQAEVLDANPLVGLVHGDMEIIDAHGQTITPSVFRHWQMDVEDGRVLGRLISNNFVSGGASLFRSSLLPAFHPIAPDAAYPDWWIAACIAAVAEITHIDAITNRYRFHGANMGLGAGPERQAEIERRELAWRRWIMRNLVDDDTVTAQHRHAALNRWMLCVVTAASAEPRGARALLDEDAGAASRVRWAAGGIPDSRTLMREFSRHPFDGALMADLEVALLRESSLPEATPAPPLIALEARDRLTIGWLEELVSCPWMLSAFAARAGQMGDETLAVLAPPGADLSALIAIAEADEQIMDERCDITVVSEPATTPAKALLAARACARLTRETSPEPYDLLAVHRAVDANIVADAERVLMGA
ncbi:MAG: glycosyltransferase [Solirubrobacteraceae bacterium]